MTETERERRSALGLPHTERVNATGTSIGVSAAVLAVLLAACSSSAPASSNATTGSSSSPTRSAAEVCLDGIHRTPHDNINVEKAKVAPLGQVKTWVLASDSSIDWSNFSSTLSRAPLTELVAVCMYTRKDGSSFTPPAGANQTPTPSQAFIAIVRENGDQTGFLFGTKDGLASQFPGNL